MADGEGGPDEACCRGGSALVVAVTIVSLGRVYTKARMPEVLELTTSERLLVSFRLFASHPKGCKNQKEVQLRI